MDLGNQITKAVLLYPTVDFVSSTCRTQTFIWKENAYHFFPCWFLKCLPLAILRLFQGFYHFLVRYKKLVGKKTTLFQIFYLFWMSGRRLSSSTESPSKLDWSMLIITFLLTYTLLLTFFVTWELHKQSWTRTCREGINLNSNIFLQLTRPSTVSPEMHIT